MDALKRPEGDDAQPQDVAASPRGDQDGIPSTSTRWAPHYHRGRRREADAVGDRADDEQEGGTHESGEGQAEDRPLPREQEGKENNTERSSGAGTPISATPALGASASLPVHIHGQSANPADGWTAKFKHRALHTGPGWFAANMGLGIASILLYNMPYSFTGLQELGLAFFVVNVMLFFFLLALTITRYVLWPRLLPIMLYHPTQAFFLGTFTMGAVTLDEIIILGLIPRLGQAWLYVGWYFWWMIAAATIVVAIGVPWITQTRQEQQFRQITAVWFLPIVAPVVCASAGSIVANAMVDAGLLAAGQGNPAAAASWYSHARVQEIACYLLLGIGLIPSLLWMPIYSTRLAIHKLPTAVIVSSFIPLGCCGQGALAVLHISRTLRRITVITGVPPLGGVDDSVGNVISPASAQAMADAIYAVSQVGALFLWGLGIVWMSLAVMSIADVLSVSDIALNLGLWASTFPVGTMAASAALFGAEFGSTAFKVISTILSVIVILDVIWIASITAIKGWTGELFHAPDLAEIGGEVPTSLPPSRKYTFEPRQSQRGAPTRSDVGHKSATAHSTCAATTSNRRSETWLPTFRSRGGSGQHPADPLGRPYTKASQTSSRSRSTSSNRTRINEIRRTSGALPLSTLLSSPDDSNVSPT